MNYYITKNGITKTKPNINDLPLREEVEFCKEILSLVKERKNFYNKSTSYGYKHILEKSLKTGYIANGSFIQAAKELNMSIKIVAPNSLNAFFKFTPKDLSIGLLNYCIKQQNISLDTEKIEQIKKQLLECQSNTSKISMEMLSGLYKNFGVDIRVKELFLILKDIGIHVKYDFGYKIENGNDELFGSESKANVSLSKLSNLLFNQSVQERSVAHVKKKVL